MSWNQQHLCICVKEMKLSETEATFKVSAESAGCQNSHFKEPEDPDTFQHFSLLLRSEGTGSLCDGSGAEWLGETKKCCSECLTATIIFYNSNHSNVSKVYNFEERCLTN